MYKLSNYIINVFDESCNKMIIFSTLTTSIVKLEMKIYEDIFENQLFDKYPCEMQTLIGGGFLIKDDFDELKYLNEMRERNMKRLNSLSSSYFMITPTMDCNARCYYCFEHGAHHEKMTFETADYVVDYIRKNTELLIDSNIVIHWFGGEPLLADDIIDYISSKLKHLGIKHFTKITTNGFCINDEIIDKMKNQWSINVVQITLDALYEEYNRIKNYVNLPKGIDAFSTVITNMHKVVDNDIQLRVRINFDPRNTEKAENTIKFLKTEFGDCPNFQVYFAPIDSHTIPSISSDFEGTKKHPLLYLNEVEEGYAGMASMAKNNQTDIERILNKYYLIPIPLSCTGVCNNNVTIDSLGDIYVCHRLLGKGQEFTSGNVKDGLENNEIKKFFQGTGLSYKECSSCKLLPLCQGGCKYRIEEYPDKQYCLPTKKIISEILLSAVREIEALV